MKDRITEWVLTSCIFGTLALIFLILFPKLITSIAYRFLTPWFEFCRFVTPDSWEITRNSFAGLLWLVSGLFVLCILAGAVTTLACHFTTRARSQLLTKIQSS